MKNNSFLKKAKLTYDTIRYTFKLLFKYKKIYFVFLFILSIINSILPILTMLSTQLLLNIIQTNENTHINIITGLAIFSLLSFSTIIFSNLNTFITNKYTQYLYYVLNKELIKSVEYLDFCDFENPTTYDLLQRAEEEIGVRPMQILSTFLHIIGSIITLLSSLTILVTWHIWILACFLIVPLFSLNFFTKISEFEFQIVLTRTNYERKSWYIANLLTKDSDIKEVKVLNLFNHLYNIFNNLRLTFFKQNNHIINRKTKVSLLYQCLNTIISLCITILAIIEASIGKILMGNLMTYINTSTKIETSIQNIVNYSLSLYQDSLYMQNVKNFYDYISYKKSNKTTGITINYISKIEFKNLYFKYPHKDNYALKNVNLVFSKKDRIALVGENGSGKSTLIKLLLGLYSNYEGDILINNINLKDIDLTSFYQCVSVIFQDFNKYQLSIKENIGYGDLANYNNFSQIKKAAILSGADDFISQLRNNYNQNVGLWFKGGIQLSGGQWQKLALARMFMKESDMYILDEPTSALDPISERNFFKNFLKKESDTIKIFSTHRFINTKFTNKIVVLSNGEVSEIGTHKELYDRKGLYYKMYKFQSLENNIRGE